jgi:histidine triad (HIT) family protein
MTSDSGSPSAVADCLFCRIVAGEIPSDQVFNSERVLAFRDIAPQAPVHIVVIPKTHHANVAELGAADPELAGELISAISAISGQETLGEGFRVVFNTGAHGGQTVGHVHAHVLAGRSLTWPPG